MYEVTYYNKTLDELVNSYEEACELVREYFGVYEPDEVFISEAEEA